MDKEVEKVDTPKQYPPGHYTSLGISLGMTFGIVIGIFMGSTVGGLGNGIAIGIAMGVAIGAGIGTKLEAKAKSEGKIRELTEEEKRKAKKNFFSPYVKYVKDNPERYWFKRKLFGWGWMPATREGWIVILLYSIGVLFFAFMLDESSTPREMVFTVIVPIVLLTAIFLAITYKKGEKPRWQWGLPKEKED